MNEKSIDLQHDHKYHFNLIAVREDGIVSPAVSGYITDNGDGDTLDIWLDAPHGVDVLICLQVKPDGSVQLRKVCLDYDCLEVAPAEVIKVFPDPKITEAIKRARRKELKDESAA